MLTLAVICMNSIPNLVKCLVDATGSSWIDRETLIAASKKYRIDLHGLRREIEECRICYCDGFFTTPQIAVAENIIANNTIRLLAARPPYIAESVIKKHIDMYEKQESVSLDPEQRKAVINSVKHNLSIITGGPGTGKTTVLKCMAYVLEQVYPGGTISFAAPTGKAAERITESTGYPAITINSKLCIGIDDYQPCTITADTLVCDEFSMVDVFLCAALFASIQSGKRLIISGDVDQLPSVGPGTTLRDFVNCGIIPLTMLVKTFRQAAGSVYYENIKRIKEGNPNLVEGDDFHLVPIESDRAVNQLLMLYIQNAKKYGVYETGCLLPFRKFGTLCSNEFNSLVQAKCNRQATVSISGREFKLGSPVIQYKNRPEVFNGEVGKIVDISEKCIVVDFEGKMVTYNESSIDQLGLAYGITIHKSQGSQYPGCIMVLANEHLRMANKNLLYTAVSRGQKEFTILYQDKALKAAFETAGDEKRKSLLSNKIQYCKQKYQLIKNQ